MTSYLPQIIHDINTVAGITGFFITVLVMLQVRSIRQTFLARARLPQINKDLRKAGSELNKHLTNWPNHKTNGHQQIKIAASLIDGALPLIPRSARRESKAIKKKLAQASRDFHSLTYDYPNIVWDLYSDIQVVIVNLDQIEKNLKWE
ncbi:hypothetical protein [Massilia oculi]|uniref:hypothetical protein n=1 Tax=Massilia oculi TaxID=945844 RepID=UPI001AAF1691|nr:hypothetical protein [Massilia oculi]